MNVHGNCDLCGECSSLSDGVCQPCLRRYARNSMLTNERLLAVLCHHVGAANGISIARLIGEMCAPLKIHAGDVQSFERAARELVVEVRLAGSHVCASPRDGYYMAATPEELDATCTFLYDRAMTSLTQVAAMKRISLPDLRGQLHLPT